VVGLKLNVYHEKSNATYLGLTTPQYQNDASDNFAVNDVLPLWRFGASLSHKVLLSDEWMLHTVLYGQLIDRNWRRQDFHRSNQGASYERIVNGEGELVADAPNDGSSIFFLPSYGHRDRTYMVAGLESRLHWEHQFGDSVASELSTGARLHWEQANVNYFDQQMGGSRAARQRETRTGRALALFAHERVTLFDRLRITPGIRFEMLWSERAISTTLVNGVPTELDSPLQNTVFTPGILPGVGLSYEFLGSMADPYSNAAPSSLVAFAGLHRGFAPPRIQDAVTNEGQDTQLNAELAWNYEAGRRYQYAQVLRAEATAYYLDFSSQIIAASESGGVALDGNEGIANAGQTTHRGVETSLIVDPARWARWGFSMPVEVGYTLTQATYGSGFNALEQGFELSYVPRHALNLGVGFEHRSGIELHVGGEYLSRQFADRADMRVNTLDSSIDGLAGAIDARFLLDARAGYRYEPWGVTLYVTGKNLTDERYVANRRPRGIQPGPFRQLMVGLAGRWN
jgi:Fe(3+) dicitrate transport protein